MSQYIISPDAIRDLEEIADYFATRNVDAGDRILDDFTKKCRYLTHINCPQSFLLHLKTLLLQPTTLID